MLSDLIDQYYIDKQRSKTQDRFWISDAGKCLRQVFFKIKKAPREEMDARVLRIFEVGDNLHLRITRVLFSLGLVKASEIEIPPQEDIGGRADAIIRLENELYLLDIKSINGMAFKYLEKPKEEHIKQIQLYMHFFRIGRGILLYECKDTQNLKEFYVEYSEELANELLDEFSKLKEKIEKGVVPPRLVDYPKNWQCNYCGFRELCDKAAGGEVSWGEVAKIAGTIKLKPVDEIKIKKVEDIPLEKDEMPF